MGVRYLETYLEKESRGACFDVNIAHIVDQYRSRTGKTPVVVIDGMSCLRPMYGNLSWLNGGQFKEFADHVNKFINNFTKLGCELVVFFDGPVQHKKLPVWKSRRLHHAKELSHLLDSFGSSASMSMERSSSTSCLPNGLGFIFLYLLKQRNCKVYKSIKECDDEIAAYARKNNCFAILAQDTDYVIYRAANYYLSIKYLDLDKMTTHCYSSDLLCDEFGIPMSRLSLFASLMGNDIIPYDLLKSFHYNLRRRSHFRNVVLQVAEYIKHMKHIDLKKIAYFVFGSRDKYELLRDSIESYESKEEKNVSRLEDTTLVNDSKWSQIVQHVKENYVNSYYPAPMYDIIIRGEFYSSTCLEDYRPSKMIKSIGNLLKELRRWTYGILLLEKPFERGQTCHYISELVMTGFQSMDQVEKITPKYLKKVKHPGYFELRTSTLKEIEETRWEILGEVFDCDVTFMKQLPDWLLVPALATRYFILQFPDIYDWELNALLATNVCVRNYESQVLAALPSDPLTYRPVWLFSAVSRTYMTVTNLFFFMGFPVSNALPYLFADGKLFHKNYRHSSNKAKSDALCDYQVQNIELFNLLRTFVINKKE